MLRAHKQLRFGLPKITFYKFKHNFGDNVNPMYLTNDDIENAKRIFAMSVFDINDVTLLLDSLLYYNDVESSKRLPVNSMIISIS